MADDFDLVILGAGPGGYVAAIRAAQLGLKTACVEKRGTLGGTCLNVGCIPSKALLHASELYAETSSGHMDQWGVGVGKVTLDLDKMVKAKDESVSGLTKGVEGLFKKNKVEWVKGTGKFKNKNTISVALTDGGTRELKAKNVIIATGSDVAGLPNVTIDGKRVVSSTEALSLPSVPKHLVVIGGGYIGLELGSVWRRLGSEVTVVEYLDRILPGMDGEVSKNFERILKKQGMTFRKSMKVTGVEALKNKAKVSVEPAKGGDAEVIEADVVLLAVGRKPHTDSLDLQNAGLKTDERGRIDINDDFSTDVPGIWAIGDVVKGPMLAHKAEDEGLACAENIAGLTGMVNHDVIPGVVYTMPEVASVGKTEEELKAAGVSYSVGKFPFMANSRAKTNKDTEGFVKILADAETDRVLGVHIIGSLAGTMIAEAALAMEFGASSEDIALTCHAHPTHPEAVKEAAMAVHGRAIHI
ncbi:dihydrolipoyl dehydrogenase [Iodidimonas gelatinilytica]|uniref:Dihydrolipoyl dehydrogenase n=1 Tax=Iodidimonas gelatinilytica TaxID=1236966 RepID=A0A5A7N3V3_9PROT|nr:dihydrolipoyl dehydrogenase [Iodidimonas gelatinilytica]GEQ98932.1 dihydrolipoyl dehydrogenase [Iodidimonas gelatinilytica]GER01726.1 dihydrolipoyl dehydrogenase [Iodidimonas gelatinilytica]